MATEEQTSGSFNVRFAGEANWDRVGQRLTITSRIVSGLSFKTYRAGTPTGSVTMTIRKVSNDSVILTKSYGSIAAVSTDTGGVWISVTFDSPALINEEVRILMEWSGTAGDTNNYLAFFNDTANPKASEKTTRYYGSYTDTSTWDATYIYTYIGGTTSPSVTVQATSSIAATTATGNGNVTSRGEPLATQHGHCWAEFSNPTLENCGLNFTQKGVPTVTGAYTSNLTALIQNTSYYCRAYITNSVGTFYSSQQSYFTTSAGVPTLTTDLATEIAATTATGNGSIDNDGGSSITAYGVVWSTSTNPTLASHVGGDSTDEGAITPPAVIGKFTSLMTGLVANTLYHYKTYATNTTGDGYGAEVDFTTGITGTPIVTTQKTTGIQSTNAFGQGTIVDIGGAEVTEHGHCWSTSVNPTAIAVETWAATHAYTTGKYVNHTTRFNYECTTAGTSGGTEPTWPTTVGGTVTDGTAPTAVVWTAVANTQTMKGTATAGAFTSLIVNLTAGTTYHTRAYATNSYGTSYGNDDSFQMFLAGAGILAIINEALCYIDKNGIQRYLVGTEF